VTVAVLLAVAVLGTYAVRAGPLGTWLGLTSGPPCTLPLPGGEELSWSAEEAMTATTTAGVGTRVGATVNGVAEAVDRALATLGDREPVTALSVREARAVYRGLPDRATRDQRAVVVAEACSRAAEAPLPDSITFTWLVPPAAGVHACCPGAEPCRRDRIRPGVAWATVLIRAAVAADWPAIWPFFDAIVRAGETYAYPEGLTSEQARGLWMEQPPSHVAVAEVDGVVVASAKAGPNRPGRGAHVATASFMVDPAQAGRGIGRALGEYVLDWARAAGYRAMQFNAVVETNTAAVALWRSLGFTVVGTVPEAFDHPQHGLVGLHIMHRYL